jgi:hypothetical protein
MTADKSGAAKTAATKTASTAKAKAGKATGAAKKAAGSAAPKATSAPRKNPDKLSGPEKTRFLSVLSKDPQLQADVVEALREAEYVIVAPRQILDDAVHRVREQAEELAAAAMGKVAGKVDELQKRDDVKALKTRAQAAAASARSKVRR